MLVPVAHHSLDGALVGHSIPGEIRLDASFFSL